MSDTNKILETYDLPSLFPKMKWDGDIAPSVAAGTAYLFPDTSLRLLVEDVEYETSGGSLASVKLAIIGSRHDIVLFEVSVTNAHSKTRADLIRSSLVEVRSILKILRDNLSAALEGV
jgi:hypothetical protein